MGKEGVRPADGAGEQVGKEGEKEGKQKEAALRRPVPPIDVDEISGRHEEVKGNTGGEDELQGRRGKGQPCGGEEPLQHGESKAQVFE